MKRPGVLQLVSNRAALSWLTLITLTPVSFFVGADHGAGSDVAILLLSIAIFKVRLVGLDFMELRNAPPLLRVAFEGYCVVLWLVLCAVYIFV